MNLSTSDVHTLHTMDIRTARLTIFRDRLDEAVRRSGLSRTEFAARAGVDRTSLTQLLSATNTRLPRLDTIAALASTHELSADWLIGLSNVGPVEAAIMQHTSFEAPGPTPVDERLLGWLDEAAGYKIRYVPATLPDLLKTDAVIHYERSGAAGPNAAQAIETSASRLTWVRNPDTEMECCSSVQGITGFARGEGIWSRLGVASRGEQLEQMIELVDELYPTFRWFMYDGRRRYAPPVTVFGPQRAALYLGDLYLVLTSAEHVRTLIHNVDGLIKVATVEPPKITTYLARLRRDLDR
jgi:transcriptional regulator with XRE-family HTH domain